MNFMNDSKHQKKTLATTEAAFYEGIFLMVLLQLLFDIFYHCPDYSDYSEEIAGALAARINCQKQLIAVKENGVSKPTFIIIILFEISVL